MLLQRMRRRWYGARALSLGKPESRTLQEEIFFFLSFQLFGTQTLALPCQAYN